MRFLEASAILGLLSLGASASPLEERAPAWSLNGYLSKACTGTPDVTNSANAATICIAPANKFQSVSFNSTDFNLVIYKSNDCSGSGSKYPNQFSCLANAGTSPVYYHSYQVVVGGGSAQDLQERKQPKAKSTAPPATEVGDGQPTKKPKPTHHHHVAEEAIAVPTSKAALDARKHHKSAPQYSTKHN